MALLHYWRGRSLIIWLLMVVVHILAVATSSGSAVSPKSVSGTSTAANSSPSVLTRNASTATTIQTTVNPTTTLNASTANPVASSVSSITSNASFGSTITTSASTRNSSTTSTSFGITVTKLLSTKGAVISGISAGNSTAASASTASSTVAGIFRSSTHTNGQGSSLWSVPFIVLLSVCAGLLIICLVCIIVICKLKKSLGRRSKLYPGAVPEDDEHTYMDLGDHPLRAPPPVELKSVTGTSDNETKLTDSKEKTKGIKSFKDRKRKPAPPLPQSAVPNKPPINKEGNGQQTTKEDKTKAKETKRQNSSMKKKPPSYNNSVPLDISDDNEIGLYESYDHKEATDSSYTHSMIEEALDDTNDKNTVKGDGSKNETQTRASFERENSNRLRNAQGSFIVSDDAHHEGLAFTERQISNSGLPEIIVQYNANKEAESPLHLQQMQAYENQAFEAIDEDATHVEEKKIEQASIDADNIDQQQITNKQINKNDGLQVGNLEPEIPLYEDENIPTTKSENADIDAIPLYEDANGNIPPDAPFYDDNYVPESIPAGTDTVDILPIYDCADDSNESQELSDNTTIDLPLYELAVETNESNQSAASSQNSNVLRTAAAETCNNDDKVDGTELTNIDELGLYEDYEISKLPPAPPPPILHALNDNLHTMVSSQSDILTLNANDVSPDNVHIEMDTGGAQNMLPPEPPKRNDLLQVQNESNRDLLMEPNNIRGENSVWDNDFALDFNAAAPGTNAVINDKLPTPSINFGQLNTDANMDFQNSNTKTPKLLDLSLEPEKKFRSGSKIDVFEEPAISQSDAYFLDMNDSPSEILDASPVIGDEKLASISTISNTMTESNRVAASDVFGNSSFGNTSNGSYGNIVLHANLRNENNKSATNETTSTALNANSVATSALLDFGNDQIVPNSKQDGFSHQFIQQNRDFNPLSDLVQTNNIGEENEIYDIPPPNFPPPELKLN